MHIPDDALLSQEELSAAFAELGLPMSPATLESKRSRGNGPPYEKYSKFVRYRWKTARDWRLGQVRHMRSTSEAAQADSPQA